MVNITMRVLSKPDTEKLATIFKGLGPDWEERVLPSIGNEVVKAVVAQYNAEQLITQRDKVSRMVRVVVSCFKLCCVFHVFHILYVFHAVQVRDNLLARAREFNIIVDDVAITHLSFGTEFTKAVEAKQVAQQEAERARCVVCFNNVPL